jgi:hypothetical protein
MGSQEENACFDFSILIFERPPQTKDSPAWLPDLNRANRDRSTLDRDMADR